MAPAGFCLAIDTEGKKCGISIIGVLQLFLGFIALTFVGVTSLVSVVYLGALLALGGISEVAFGLRHPQNGGLWIHVFFGTLSTVCGLLIFLNPLANLVVLTMLIAVYFITSGLVTVVGSLIERFNEWFWFLFHGIISVIAGVFILSGPIESSVWSIGVFVGIQMISKGIAWISICLMLPKFPKVSLS